MEAGNKFTIGRDKACDIPIADDSVSRFHAELTLLESGQLLLTDLKSSNGTSIIERGRPKRIDRAYVSAGDHIQFGEVILSVTAIIDNRPTLWSLSDNGYYVKSPEWPLRATMTVEAPFLARWLPLGPGCGSAALICSGCW